VSGLEILRQLRAEPAWNHLPIVILSAASDPDTKRQALLTGATDFLSKPADFTEAVARVRNCLAVKAHHDGLKSHAQELERQVQQRTAELRMSRLEEIRCLARVAECRTDLTQMHSVRVSGYAGVIGRRMGLSDPCLEVLELAVLLHDVGKIGFPDSLLSRSGWFTPQEIELLQRHNVPQLHMYQCISPQEWSTFKSHTVGGSRVMAVGESRILELGAIVALSHHEKWDGTGYPFGLKGEKIPLEGRIAAVANALDVLGARQSYRPLLSEEDCRAIVTGGAGTHFDPKVVEAFLAGWDQIMAVKAKSPGPRRPTGSPGAPAEKR
jgi:putative two-component system response regulator